MNLVVPPLMTMAHLMVVLIEGAGFPGVAGRSSLVVFLGSCSGRPRDRGNVLDFSECLASATLGLRPCLVFLHTARRKVEPAHMPGDCCLKSTQLELSVLMQLSVLLPTTMVLAELPSLVSEGVVAER